MKDIAIYGAGGFGREVYCLIDKINAVRKEWNFIGFFDDGLPIDLPVKHYGKVLGGIDIVNAWPHELAVVFAMGSVDNLVNITSQIKNANITFPNIIHPDAIFASRESFSMGQGNIIQRASAFSCDVTIGDFNVFNGGTVLGHDVSMGSCNILMPAVRVSGETKIGNANFFGINSIVLHGITVGNKVKLSAGSVLMTKPKDGTLYMGNPAKKTEF